MPEPKSPTRTSGLSASVLPFRAAPRTSMKRLICFHLRDIAGTSWRSPLTSCVRPQVGPERRVERQRALLVVVVRRRRGGRGVGHACRCGRQAPDPQAGLALAAVGQLHVLRARLQVRMREVPAEHRGASSAQASSAGWFLVTSRVA